MPILSYGKEGWVRQERHTSGLWQEWGAVKQEQIGSRLM